MTDALYIIETADGQLAGERNWSKQDALTAILTQEYGAVKRVVEIRLDERHSEDITEDCARELSSQFYADREPVSWEVMNFLHDQLGVTSTHGLNVEAAA